MASQPHGICAAVSARTVLLMQAVALIFGVGCILSVQAQDPGPVHAEETWTAMTQTSVVNTNPWRTSESRSKSGNRSLEKVRVEQPDLNGRYQPVSETETETIQIDPATERTVVRTYAWDINGKRNLTQITEEEAVVQASGDAHIVRITSNCDEYGHVQVMGSEISDKKYISPDIRETMTTLLLLDANGELAPAEQTRELQSRNFDHSVETRKTKLLPDSAGNWRVSEVRESTSKQDGKNRRSEERVWRADSDNRLSEIAHTIVTDLEPTAGEKKSISEKYSTDIPGRTPDGSLHLNLRILTLQKQESGMETTEEQVEQRKPGDPGARLQVSTRTAYIVQYGASGTRETKTVQVRDINGTFQVNSVETRKSDSLPAR
jgi:hypothetical protein